MFAAGLAVIGDSVELAHVGEMEGDKQYRLAFVQHAIHHGAFHTDEKISLADSIYLRINSVAARQFLHIGSIVPRDHHLHVQIGFRHDEIPAPAVVEPTWSE